MEPALHRRNSVKQATATTLGASLAPHIVCAKVSGPTVEEYTSFDALELADLVRRREVKAEELLETAIAHAKLVDPKINSIAGELYQFARNEVERGLPAGPFTGVPFLLKDISFFLKGQVSSHGSKLYEDYRPKLNSTVVDRYRKAGLVIFARTTTPEFGLITTTESKQFGITRNPWNLERTAGGSSGGTAAAVAAGIAPMGSGSDGGGSIRIPASCCGLFGMKPSRARVPVGPHRFEKWGGLACVHAITRSVRDSAALLDASHGPVSGDAYAAPAAGTVSYLQEVAREPKQLRIALIQTAPPLPNVHQQCRDAVLESAKLCESLGHNVEDATEPFAQAMSWERMRSALGVQALVSVAAAINGRLSELKRDLEEGDLETGTAWCFEEAQKYTAFDLNHARDTFHNSSREMDRFLQQFDVILTPTLGKPPIPHGLVTLTTSDPGTVGREMTEFSPFTMLANCTGQPAMSVPLHWTQDDLPIGVQFLARFGDEATLFQLAGQLERARPWKDRRPPEIG